MDDLYDINFHSKNKFYKIHNCYNTIIVLIIYS
jgi:hypothetical protein